MVTAESLTGGLIAKQITDIPGSSAVFWGSVVAYSIAAKQRLLSVPAGIIENFGVVSTQTASAMASGAIKAVGDSTVPLYALAVTGIAGPGGGTANISVGTVCIAIAYGQNNRNTTVLAAKLHHFSGIRTVIRQKTCIASMQLLASYLTPR